MGAAEKNSEFKTLCSWSSSVPGTHPSPTFPLEPGITSLPLPECIACWGPEVQYLESAIFIGGTELTNYQLPQKQKIVRRLPKKKVKDFIPPRPVLR